MIEIKIKNRGETVESMANPGVLGVRDMSVLADVRSPFSILYLDFNWNHIPLFSVYLA